MNWNPFRLMLILGDVYVPHFRGYNWPMQLQLICWNNATVLLFGLEKKIVIWIVLHHFSLEKNPFQNTAYIICRPLCLGLRVWIHKTKKFSCNELARRGNCSLKQGKQNSPVAKKLVNGKSSISSNSVQRQPCYLEAHNIQNEDKYHGTFPMAQSRVVCQADIFLNTQNQLVAIQSTENLVQYVHCWVVGNLLSCCYPWIWNIKIPKNP